MNKNEFETKYNDPDCGRDKLLFDIFKSHGFEDYEIEFIVNYITLTCEDHIEENQKYLNDPYR